jgi:hypothetical protein
MKLRVGQEVDLQADKRYIQHVRGYAMNLRRTRMRCVTLAVWIVRTSIS